VSVCTRYRPWPVTAVSISAGASRRRRGPLQARQTYKQAAVSPKVQEYGPYTAAYAIVIPHDKEMHTLMLQREADAERDPELIRDARLRPEAE